MKIAVVASEAAPFVKTGGLGDVMQALPLALSKQKNTYVSLFLPYYSQIKYSEKWPVEFLGAFDVPLAWRREYVGIFRLKTRRKKLQIHFIDNERLLPGDEKRLHHPRHRVSGQVQPAVQL